LEVAMSRRRLDSTALRDWAHTAVGGLISHTDEINRLNVFPVADADTGTNMLFTMRSAWAQADELFDCDVAQVAAALAGGAVQGARGNSGVILSQILRGLAEVTAAAAAHRGGELADIDAALFAAALRCGVDLVVTSMAEALPGTIVSVLQAAAGAAEQAVGGAAELDVVVCAAADAGAVALDQTTRQLVVLAEAGVVDAGGRGLLVLLDALTATLTGDAPDRAEYVPVPPDTDRPTTASAPPAFEVMYLLIGCDADGADKLRERLEQLGESVVIAASDADGVESYSVHVHANDAGGAVEAGLSCGTPTRIQITALSGSLRNHPPGGWSRDRTVLAVVDGDGAEELFASEGAQVLRPSRDAVDPATAITAETLLRALVDTGAAQIMVLPNGYVAAEELVAGCTAAIGWGIDVVPVPAGSMVQGLAALAVHDAQREAVDDGYTMARAAASARHGSVRVATERALTWAGPCEPGDGLGIAGDEVLVVRRDVGAAARRLLDLLLAAGGDLVTVLIGADANERVGTDLEAHVHRHHPGTELIAYRTGHRGDALLIGVE
jgi:DAK2 domain fusion protein YloV